MLLHHLPLSCSQCVSTTISVVKGYSVRRDFTGQFFRIFEIIMFCFVTAILKLVHDLEAIFHLP